jgi:diguanylate cyclase (GGDEF)-like protein
MEPARVLVLDADKQQRASVLLGNDPQFLLSTVSNSDALMESLSSDDIECVIIEKSAKDSRSFEAFQRIRKDYRFLPAVIMINSSGHEAEAIKAFRSGFNDYLTDNLANREILSGAVLRAIEKEKEKRDIFDENTRLSALLDQDYLTGLSNNRHLEKLFSAVEASAGRQGHQVAIVFVDVNHFKKINDNYGHKVGDGVLRKFASKLRGLARPDETFGRYDADKFVGILDRGVSEDTVRACCERLHQEMKFRINLEEISIVVSASIGAAIYPVDGGDFGALVASADRAMVEAKTSGRGWLLAGDLAGSKSADQADHAPSESSPAAVVTGRSDIAGVSGAARIAGESTAEAAQMPASAADKVGAAVSLAAVAPVPATDIDDDSVVREGNLRDTRRNRVFMRGVIVTEDGFSTMNCVIRDLSETGALISVEGVFNVVPQRFSLLVGEARNEKFAEKRWENGGRIGLRFLDDKDRQAFHTNLPDSNGTVGR